MKPKTLFVVHGLKWEAEMGRRKTQKKISDNKRENLYIVFAIIYFKDNSG